MNRWFLFGAMLILGVLGYGVYATLQHDEPLFLPLFQEQYTVKRIRVIQGHEFDLTLRDGRRIHAFLKDAHTTPEAKPKVIAFINQQVRPTVIVYEKKEDGWLVDLSFSGNSLLSWLKYNRLIYDDR